MRHKHRQKKRASKSAPAVGSGRRRTAVQLLDDFLTKGESFETVMEAIETDHRVAGEIVRELQSRRDREELPAKRTDQLIHSLTEWEAVTKSDSDSVLRAISARINQVERQHGSQADEDWFADEGPAEWQLLNRAWAAMLAATQAKLLTSYGEQRLAERLASGDVGLPEVIMELLNEDDGPLPVPDALEKASGSPPAPLSGHSIEPAIEQDLVSLEIDPGDLCMALEDADSEHMWYLNRNTGEVAFISPDMDFDDDQPDLENDDHWLAVDPISSSDGYRIMLDFVFKLPHGAYRERLEHALDGPRPFRRFKDALAEDPQQREAWFAFHECRILKYGEEWLESEGIQARWRSGAPGGSQDS